MIQSHQFQFLMKTQTLALTWIWIGLGLIHPQLVRAEAVHRSYPMEKQSNLLLKEQPAQVLLYHGVATALGDAEALGAILEAHGITYDEVSSAELNEMSLADLLTYRVILWPGGYAGQMSKSLQPQTRAWIRRAVREYGVNFVGFCAGAFIAVGPEAQGSAIAPDTGFSLLSQESLPYYHLEDEGIEYAMVGLRFANSSVRSVLWWGGPSLPEVPHGVIARYEDTDQAAIIQADTGKGMIFLSGPHPEAPESWREKLGLHDPDGLDQDLAWQMIEAALSGTRLPTLK